MNANARQAALINQRFNDLLADILTLVLQVKSDSVRGFVPLRELVARHNADSPDLVVPTGDGFSKVIPAYFKSIFDLAFDLKGYTHVRRESHDIGTYLLPEAEQEKSALPRYAFGAHSALGRQVIEYCDSVIAAAKEASKSQDISKYDSSIPILLADLQLVKDCIERFDERVHRIIAPSADAASSHAGGLYFGEAKRTTSTENTSVTGDFDAMLAAKVAERAKGYRDLRTGKG